MIHYGMVKFLLVHKKPKVFFKNSISVHSLKLPPPVMFQLQLGPITDCTCWSVSGEKPTNFLPLNSVLFTGFEVHKISGNSKASNI